MTKAPLGHRLDHHVDVAAVIEVPVADGDGIEPGEVDLALGVLDDGARSGIKGDARQSVFDVQAAGRGQLLGDHEPRARGAHERDFHVSATSDSFCSVGPPKYRS